MTKDYSHTIAYQPWRGEEDWHREREESMYSADPSKWWINRRRHKRTFLKLQRQQRRNPHARKSRGWRRHVRTQKAA